MSGWGCARCGAPGPLNAWRQLEVCDRCRLSLVDWAQNYETMIRAIVDRLGRARASQGAQVTGYFR